MHRYRHSSLPLVRTDSRVALCAVAALLCACSKPPDNTPRSSSVSDAPASASPGANPDPKAVSNPLTDDLSPTLCKILNELAAEAPKLNAVGTQAQLVISIAAAFNSRADALQRVSAEIDAVTTAACPTSRDAVLKVLKMQSLREAVR